MALKAHFDPHLYIWFRLILLLIFSSIIAVAVNGQTATYHLHAENSAGVYQLKTAGPDAPSSVLKSINLKNAANGNYLIAPFVTLSGEPNASGIIPAGSVVSVSLWLRKSSSQGVMFPRVTVNLNTSTGASVCVLTSSTPLTTTLTKYTLTGTAPTNISMSATDRFYLWVGITLTAKSTQNNQAELNIEGTLNGNHDSLLTVPLPVSPPTISSLSPNAGAVGTSVTIAGTNFGATQGSSSVTFNGISATASSWSPTSIVAAVPAGSTTGPVLVTVAGQATNGVTFTVTAPGAIAGIITTTSNGVAISGASVEALQAGVVKASTVSVANGSYTLANLDAGTYDVRVTALGYVTRTQDAVVVTANTTTTVNHQLDAVAQGGPGTIRYIYDELGRLVAVGTPTEVATYTYDVVGNLLSISRGNSSQASIIEFTPNRGPIGAEVTIYGTAFSTTPSQNAVTFNGVAAGVTSATSTKIVVQVPAGATTGPIAVTTPAGTATSSTPFIVANSAPSISGFNPTIGNVGTTVTITGTNFESTSYNNRVDFNQTLSTVTSATNTSISTSVPQKGGSGRITVSTPVGTATSNDDFIIPPPPFTAADIEVTGRMAIGQSRNVAISTTQKIAVIIFDGVAGQWVSLGMTDTTGTTGFFGNVTIYNTDATTLLAPFGFSKDGGGTPSVRLPVTGTYSIVVDPWEQIVGGVTLTLSEDLSPPISINGPPVTMTNRAGQNERLFFSGTAGQWISLGVSDTTIGGVTLCCGASTVAIYKPDGTTLLEPLAFYQSNPITTTPSFQLPVTGTYLLLVDPYNAVAGNVTITLSEDLSPPFSINGPPRVLEFARVGQNSRVLFSGGAGQWVSLGMSDSTISSPHPGTVTVYKPDGSTLLGPVNFFQSGGTTQSFQLPTTGTYVIIIEPFNNLLGSVTLTLSEDLSPPISINGPPVVLEFARVGQNSRLLFEGNAGQWVSLGLSNTTISAVDCCATSTVAIYNPDGSTLLGPFSFYQTGGGTPSLQLPMTGTYVIVVEPYNNLLGSVTLTLSEDLSPPISIDGPAVTITNRAGQNGRLFFSGNAGQRISLTITNVTIGAPGGCCPTSTVTIYKPDGTALLPPMSLSQADTITDSFTLPTTGTYMIVVDPYIAVAGNVTLTLIEDLSPPISVNGGPVFLNFNRLGQNATIRFDGLAGQQVTVRITGNSIQPVIVSLWRTNGPQIVGVASIESSFNLPSQILPATGSYTILIDPMNNSTGSLTISVTNP